MAYSTGAYQMSFKDAAGKLVPDRGKYVTVWKKQTGGSWKVALDIFNSDLPATAAQ
jgi:ketosteroid isomerase-like protein